MNFADFPPHRRIAALFAGPIDSQHLGLEGWKLSDIDAFHENLDMWAKLPGDELTLLFSVPLTGIRQNIANVRDTHVGLFGSRLTKPSYMRSVVNEYLKRGYDVIEVRGTDSLYTQSTVTKPVQIYMKEENNGR